jgi:hypothetical protein
MLRTSPSVVKTFSFKAFVVEAPVEALDEIVDDRQSPDPPT